MYLYVYSYKYIHKYFYNTILAMETEFLKYSGIAWLAFQDFHQETFTHCE